MCYFFGFDPSTNKGARNYYEILKISNRHLKLALLTLPEETLSQLRKIFPKCFEKSESEPQGIMPLSLIQEMAYLHALNSGYGPVSANFEKLCMWGEALENWLNLDLKALKLSLDSDDEDKDVQDMLQSIKWQLEKMPYVPMSHVILNDKEYIITELYAYFDNQEQGKVEIGESLKEKYIGCCIILPVEWFDFNK